jgi:hypothetical protein
LSIKTTPVIQDEYKRKTSAEVNQRENKKAPRHSHAYGALLHLTNPDGIGGICV